MGELLYRRTNVRMYVHTLFTYRAFLDLNLNQGDLAPDDPRN